MNSGANPAVAPARRPGEGGPFPGLILILSAGSGCAALIYELVWFQLLQLVIGSSGVSLGILLGTFMGGLCAGSLWLPRWLPRSSSPLRPWACIEAGIGLLGLAVFFGLPPAAHFYAANAVHGLAGMLLRGGLCALCLLPPTLLMGATLPVLARSVEATREGISRLGLFYGANIAGAVTGCIAAGFYFLRLHDMATTTFVAVAINALLALAGWNLATKQAPAPFTALEPSQPQAGEVGASGAAKPGAVPAGLRRALYLTIGLSGLCALSAEVVWTRLLSLLLGPSVYAFSIILAVFLAGLGLGSLAGARWGRESREPHRLLGWCQLLQVGAIAWAAQILGKSLPFWPINPSLSTNIWFNFQLDLVRCLWALLPATFLWGASFPLALAAVGENRGDLDRVVGRVYAANTLGAIAGALGCGIILVAWIGTQRVQQLLALLSAVGALLLLLAGSGHLPTRRPARLAFYSVLTAGVAVVATWSIPVLPWQLVAYGRLLPSRAEVGKLLYVGEGVNATVAVTQLSSGVKNFHVSGKVEASSDSRDMRLQRMLGHLPAALHPNARSVLVVGCGAGVTAGSFVAYPGIEKIVICEIEPLIPRRVTRQFTNENHNVLADPRVHVVYDDARHYVLTCREKFDIITSDPIHPWVKGAATLYTRDYFELCRRILNPGGVVTQWIPLYESSTEVVRSELATFFDAFPEGTLWSNDNMGEGYDMVALGQVEPLKVNLDSVITRFARADHDRATQSLRDVGFRSAFSLLTTYAGSAADLRGWLHGAELNRDSNLRLQYLAGLGLNAYEPERIFSELSVYRTYPKNIFSGAEAWTGALKLAIEHPAKE